MNKKFYKKKNKKKRIKNIFGTLIIILVIVFIFVNQSYNNALKTPLKNMGSDVVFIVDKGEGVKTISKNLKEVDLIESDFYFNTYVKKNDFQTKLQAGEYILNPSMNIIEIVNVLKGGMVINRERVIKVIEGWTMSDIGEYLEKEGIFTKKEFLDLTGEPMVDYSKKYFANSPKDYSKEYDFLKDKPKGSGLEGYLFPDTYRIFADANLDDIIHKMLDNLNDKLTEKMREDIKAQGKTIYEIITMASVIQKEVRSESDMKMVSGLFWNRIENGQALESCASLAYITGINKDQYTYEDTRINSPYNTYQNRGLPPGPIASPGIQAIIAAIYPTDNSYNYFLSNPANGETIFSKTYEEHLRNKSKYLD